MKLLYFLPEKRNQDVYSCWLLNIREGEAKDAEHVMREFALTAA